MTAPKKDSIRLTLTRDELIHLRDLMSIVLPPDGERTISSALSALTKSQMKEGILWKKISDLCAKNKIDIGSDAPDFYLDFAVPPVIGVFASASSESSEEEEE